jgi:chemotaxis protein MotB
MNSKVSKMNNKLIITTIFIGYIFFTGCVSSKQFKELQSEKMACEMKKEELLAQNEELTVANNEYASKLAVMEEQLEELMNDSLQKAAEIKKLNRQLSRMEQQYKDLEFSLETLRRGNAEETRKLLRELQTTQATLQEKEDALLILEDEVEKKQKNLQQLQRELEQRNAKLVELENILQRKDSAVNALRDKVSQALLGFENEGLKVSLKNGKVYVSLDEELLFGTGSTQVDPKGRQALTRLADVLEQNNDINVMIEGHTDDVPVRQGSTFKDNWDLSTLRATAIVRILLEESSMDPRRLIAAGRGEHMPVNPAKTSEARQMNRRTEIILTPKLDELFQILETN